MINSLVSAVVILWFPNGHNRCQITYSWLYIALASIGQVAVGLLDANLPVQIWEPICKNKLVYIVVSIYKY